jgi:iron complex transport system ATP-binding protein
MANECKIKKVMVDQIEFSYKKTKVLKKISLNICQGEFTVIVGPNGSGKSTTVKCSTGLLKPSSGKVLIEKQDIKKMTFQEISNYIGYVPQHYQVTFPVKVFESVLIGTVKGVNWKSSQQQLDAVDEVMDLLDLHEIADRNTNELSGGQQQRVTIARALAKRPSFLFMDEPTSGLDLKNQQDVMRLMKDLATKKNVGVLAIIHDLNLASEIADNIIMMKNGEIFVNGKPEDVITPGNIEAVFGVKSKIIEHLGKPHMLRM